MSSPMNVLEETPKVWLVVRRWYGDKEVQAIFKTEERAQQFLGTQPANERDNLYIDWEVLRD